MIFISLVFKVYKSARFPVKTSLYDHKLLSSFANVPTFYVVPRSVVPVIARVQISDVSGLAPVPRSIVQAYERVPRIGVPAFYDVPRSEDPA